METVYAEKTTKWGIKLWFLCDSISGYCLTFRVYTGRATNTDLICEFGLAYTVVMELMQHYLMRHHHLYADNFFSSLPLVEDLYAADTYYCGTLRKDRVGIPRRLQNVPLQKYESVKWQQDHSQIIVTNWKDEKCLCYCYKQWWCRCHEGPHKNLSGRNDHNPFRHHQLQ